jgi:NAD-dependent dihydropyrimidine dehydrogenase PreA subunit
MIRQVIRIDEEKCDGCGICADACHEGALAVIDGKAKLIRDDLCDGMGNCLPTCPRGAISFETREATPFVEVPAVPVHSVNSNIFNKKNEERFNSLAQWPIQIRLVPVNAPFLRGADILIAADCTAFSYVAIHKEFLENRALLVGCPKLDPDQTEKLAEIFRVNEIKSVTALIMEVPCCGGLDRSIRSAIRASGKNIPYSCRTVTTHGALIKEKTGLGRV